MSNAPRTLIEFVEQLPAGRSLSEAVAHKTHVIHINGEQVLVESDSIDVSFGHGELTKVTLTILPTEVRFNAHEATS